MSGIVCGFAGRIGSGKTSVSELIARHFNWPRVSFGEYVRKVAQERGLDSSSRGVLQTLGETLIQDNIGHFCRSVINQTTWKPGESLVIDGIRHHDILNKLKDIVRPSPFVLVYIYIDEDSRLERLAKRDRLNQLEIDKADGHSTEKDVKLVLQQLADITIDGKQSLTVMVSEIVNYLIVRRR
jgi:dephospho-CoA kinase